LIQSAVDQALREDLHAGDVTSDAVLGRDAQALATATAKQRLVTCGSEVFAKVFYTVDLGLRVEELLADGTLVEPGTALYRVEGSAHSILLAERTALNFIQRMAGIASLTRRYVDRVPTGSKTRIVDTRKTTPGLRVFERYAVRTGGAFNHRDSLGAGVMIKDNHIRAAGGMRAAVLKARGVAPHLHRIEVEVESLLQLDEALELQVDVVMLDNFEPSELEKAMATVNGSALVEVSGGITLERIETLCQMGVDIISVGALTHSAAAADISLSLELLGS
jgi:nicotinate-nucleotide pyrophosphorylase (carboxylating)